MKGNKKEILIQFNKQNILDTAKQLFIEKGVNRTTMDDIAKTSECSKSTIYVYFKSKDEIYNHIIYEHMLLLKNALIKSVKQSKNFEECFFSICNSIVHFQESYPLYFESLLGEISIKQEDFDKQPILYEIYTVGEEINEIIKSILEDGIKQKYVRPDIKPLPLTFTLWSSICSVISIAHKKTDYIKSSMQMDKNEFLQYSFETLLSSILISRK